MKCQQCSGCFTESGCSVTTLTKAEIMNDTTRFMKLVDLASDNNHKKMDQEGHCHIIPTIVRELSKNVYSSQSALYTAHQHLPLLEFLELSKQLYLFHIVGVHIAWAVEYSHNDMQLLLSILKDSDEQEKKKLLQYCNEHAEIHELFGNLAAGSIGRAGGP
ncbi:hypothetical protein BDB01DRAFT_797634 [Pilobolus umbonatus]|nr:hypothetical protein BDB01DRAFT_797634 [Pilobolus umbonatus]